VTISLRLPCRQACRRCGTSAARRERQRKLVSRSASTASGVGSRQGVISPDSRRLAGDSSRCRGVGPASRTICRRIARRCFRTPVGKTAGWPMFRRRGINARSRSPVEWSGRRIALAVEYLNSFAAVYVDGKHAGDLRFPGGELDLSLLCRPGQSHLLSLHVAALPLKGVMLSYTDTNSARASRGRVARRGLCGDVYLASTPPGPHVAEVKIDASVRERAITFDVALDDLTPDTHYKLSRAHRRLLRAARRRFTIERSWPRGRSQSRSPRLAADHLGSNDRRRRRTGNSERPEHCLLPVGPLAVRRRKAAEPQEDTSPLVVPSNATARQSRRRDVDSDRLHVPVAPLAPPRWQTGLYLGQPEEWDDPYRFFRW